MADSFFTSTNMIDAQLKNASDQALNELFEASVRRMTVVNGAYQTAIRVQRIADIVAAVPHAPLYDWYPPAMPPRKIPQRLAMALDMASCVGLGAGVGFLLGYWMGLG